jgi:hypothetical protein
MMVKLIVTCIATAGLQDLSTVHLQHHCFEVERKVMDWNSSKMIRYLERLDIQQWFLTLGIYQVEVNNCTSKLYLSIIQYG